MKKLITLSKKVDILELAYNVNGGSFVMQEVNELIDYKRFLDQPLTKEMFEEKTAIFEGAFTRQGESNLSLSGGFKFGEYVIFFTPSTNYPNFSLYSENSKCRTFICYPSSLHDLAEITKENPINLK